MENFNSEINKVLSTFNKNSILLIDKHLLLGMNDGLMPKKSDLSNYKIIKLSEYAVIYEISMPYVLSQFGDYSVDGVIEALKIANKDTQCIGVIMKTNCIGGEVYATSKVIDYIKILEKNKPTIQFIDGVSFSGAVRIGVHCNLIIAANEEVRTGSIGVLASVNKLFIKMKKEYVIDIYADGSEKKNNESKLLEKEQYQQYKEQYINPIRERFVKDVIKGRSSIDEKVLSGDSFFAYEAKKLKLIDMIGNNDVAISMIKKLSKKFLTKKALENV